MSLSFYLIVAILTLYLILTTVVLAVCWSFKCLDHEKIPEAIDYLPTQLQGEARKFRLMVDREL